MSEHVVLPLAGTDLVEPVAEGWQLITDALVAIAVIVTLITLAKVHPFLALTLGGLTVGILAGVGAEVVDRGDRAGATASGWTGARSPRSSAARSARSPGSC